MTRISKNETEFENLASDINFAQFIDRRFEKVTSGATLEEMAEWAFGSIVAAVKAWKAEHAKK